MSSPNSPVSTARSTSGSSVSSEEMMPAAVTSLSGSRSATRKGRSLVLSSGRGGELGHVLLTHAGQPVQTRCPIGGDAGDHQHRGGGAEPGGAGQGMRATAGPARDQAALGADRGEDGGGVGRDVHDAAAGLAGGVPVPRPRRASPGEARARALPVPAPAAGWQHRASRGGTPAEARPWGPLTRMSRRLAIRQPHMIRTIHAAILAAWREHRAFRAAAHFFIF